MAVVAKPLSKGNAKAAKDIPTTIIVKVLTYFKNLYDVGLPDSSSVFFFIILLKTVLDKTL